MEDAISYIFQGIDEYFFFLEVESISTNPFELTMVTAYPSYLSLSSANTLERKTERKLTL